MTVQKEILVSKHHLDILKKHSMQGEPNESCAILIGRTEGQSFSVEDLFLTENSLKSPVSFTISSEELISAYRESERRNLEITGIFHSHPNSEARPSSTDLRYMDVNPVPWVIYSGITGEFRAYILESVLVPVELIVR